MPDAIKQHVLTLATAVFGDKEIAEKWLGTSNRRFYGKTPLEMLESSTGAEEVEAVLLQAYFGYVG